ncbi:hypothetical protein V8E55_001464 [Tylopilus felleus]
MPPLSFHTPSSPFSLDFAGIAALLGGDDTVSAMTKVHVYEKRWWLGLYNSPGSFKVAKRLNSLATSSSSNSGSSAVHVDLTTLLEPDRSKWPNFRGAHSGTIMDETGYLATLFMKECSTRGSERAVVEGRKTQPVEITIADLGQAPDSEMRPAHSSPFILLSASFPIIVSVGACAICAVFEDWYASSLILIGILANGLSGLVLGSADFVFTHPEPAKGSPAGDGILRSDKTIVLLRGEEGAVNSITRGSFSLRFSSTTHYNLIRCCSLFFFVQGITQLFLIPQASLPGQLLFLISMSVSGLYNIWLSSLDKEKIHRKMLYNQVLQNPTLTKYTLGTYTTAVVFMLLVLHISDPNNLLNALLPNDTDAWRKWKTTILVWLRDPNDRAFPLDDLTWFTDQEREMLGLLYEDARSAYNGYQLYRAGRTQHHHLIDFDTVVSATPTTRPSHSMT